MLNIKLLEKHKSKLLGGITSHHSECPSLKILQSTSNKCWKGYEEYIAGGDVTWYSHYGEQHEDSLKN